VLDLVFPRRCVACGTSGTTLCETCLRTLPRLRPPWCERCGAPTAWPVKRCVECSGRRLAFASARAAVAYNDPVRALVAAWKEDGLRDLAALAADLVEPVPRPEADALTWVPAVRDRELKRGHHPAERLARELSERWELPAERILRRRGPGRQQRGSSLAERRRNVRSAFAPTAPAPRRVLLIDDVYTSGATANAAASALRRSGARSVDVVTFARTLRQP
jgi:ComF family protein